MAETLSSPLPRLSRRTLLKTAAAAGTTALVGMPHIARAADPVRFSLDLRIYGGTAPFFYGQEKGFFKDAGIDIQIDSASGSGEAVRRLAAGTHDFGFVDYATIVEFTARNRDAGIKGLMTIFDGFPAVVLSLKRKPLQTLDQLVGTKIGVAASSAATRILPALLKAHNIQPEQIQFQNIDVKLRDTMLLKGEVDAVIAFDYTAIFNLVESGVKRDDIVLLYYSKNGFASPGNSLTGSKAMIETKPDLTKRMTEAVARSWVEASKDREAAIASIVKRDRLLDARVEVERMSYLYDTHILTPNVKANGLGAVTDERLQTTLNILAESLDISPPLSIAQTYDPRFLPSAAARKFS